MDRRAFVGGIGGALAWPVVSPAQRSKVHRIGALIIGNADAESFSTELRGELRKFGDCRGGERPVRLPLRRGEA